MKQQPLPWNVTGIPSEARQVARDAASREGLSVGDWLTRRILNEAGAGQPENDAPVPASFPAPATTGDQGGIAARLTEIESEAGTAFRTIDETMRALSHRLEATERSQRDSNRAMSAAAVEINAATHEQAQAFEALTQRIDRVERTADGGPLRDAVRALHQALSRLAEQVSRTAAESSGQINSIASTVDGLADRVTAAQDEFAQQLRTVVAQSEELSNRLNVAEEKLTLLTPLEDVVLQLQVRMTSVEDQFNQSIERNFSAIERNLENIGARLERIERSQSESGGQVQETLRAFDERLDAIDLRSNESLTDLRAGLEAVTRRLDSAAEPPPSEFPRAMPVVEVETPPPTDMTVAPAADEFELPPFPESPPFPSGNFDFVRPAEDGYQPPAILDEPQQETQVPSSDEPREEPEVASSPVAENYLAAARRAAQAAATAEAQHKSRSSLGSIRSNVSLDRRGRGAGRTRPIVVATLLVTLAVLTGFLVTRGVNPFAPAPVVPAQSGGTALAPIFTTAPPAEGAQDLSGAANATSPADAGATAGAQFSPDASAVGAAPESTPPIAAVPVSPAPPAAAAPQASAPPATSPLDRILAKANAGSVPAALLLGLKYADADGVAANDAEAARWLTFAAQRGEALAQYRLGTLYERGRGVTADAPQAFFWYKQAATGGNRKAMHNLAVAYADGLGTEKNFTEAARWFRSAADLGLADSQFNLAVLYERGLGVAASLPEAYKWYVIAAAGGDAESKTRADALGPQLSPSQRQTGDKAAQSFMPKPADHGANEPPDLTVVAP